MAKSKECAGCGAALRKEDDAEFGWCRDCYFGGKYHEHESPRLARGLRELRKIPGVRRAALEHTGGNNWWVIVTLDDARDAGDEHPRGKHAVLLEAVKTVDGGWHYDTGVPGTDGRWHALVYRDFDGYEHGDALDEGAGLTTAQLLAFVKQHAAPARAAGKGPRPTHRLLIDSLHDARARCSCGGWTYSFTGPRMRGEVEAAHRLHVQAQTRSSLRGAGKWPRAGKGRRAATGDRCPGRMMAGARYCKCGVCGRIDHEKNEGDRCTFPARPAGWRPRAHVGSGSFAAQVLKLTKKGG